MLAAECNRCDIIEVILKHKVAVEVKSSKVYSPGTPMHLYCYTYVVHLCTCAYLYLYCLHMYNDPYISDGMPVFPPSCTKQLLI